MPNKISSEKEISFAPIKKEILFEKFNSNNILIAIRIRPLKTTLIF